MQQGFDFDYADYFAQISVLGDLLRDRPERAWLTTMPRDPEPKQYVVWLGCNVLRTVHIVETLDDSGGGAKAGDHDTWPVCLHSSSAPSLRCRRGPGGTAASGPGDQAETSARRT